MTRMHRPKNKWRKAQAVLVFGLVLRAGTALAQNILANPGFESGDTSGWFAFGPVSLSVETSPVHSGNYACLMANRTATFNGIAQSLTGELQAGQTYNVSAWVQLASGSSQTMQLTMQKIDGSGTNYMSIADGFVSAGGWTQLSGQYTYNPQGSVFAVNIYAEILSSATTSYYIDDVSMTPADGTSSGQCVVDLTSTAQRIDGFGASSAWRTAWTASEANMFFGTNNGTGTSVDGTTSFPFTGIGLSLLRNHIVFANTTSASDTPTTGETGIMQMAQSLGAKIWSTPWTPAAGFKASNDIFDSGTATGGGINGGSFLGGGNNITNLNYASQLANYVASMKNQGINLYGISVQNEPDVNVTSYEACQWTGEQIHDFVSVLYSALAARGVSATKIILPESGNWSDPQNLVAPTLNDPSTAAQAGIIAKHDYDYSPAPLNTSGTPLWETEVSTFDAFDDSMNNALFWANQIHSFMTYAQVNAWHFWWLISFNPDNEGLTDTNGIPAKRMYVLGQYARFVRPGYYRVNVPVNTGSPLVSAYKDPATGNFAIVAINAGSTDYAQAFSFTNVSGISTVTPWITSATMSLANQSPVAVNGGSFTYALPAQSVVTFVGQTGSGTPSNIVISSAVRPTGGSSFVLTWNATAGATYSVQRANVLHGSPSDWSAIVTGYPSGGATGGSLSYTDTTATAGTAFYRVRSP